MGESEENKLKKLTVDGLSWSVAGQVIIQLSTFFIGILMVRLLSPREFGLMSMIVVLTGFANVFRSFGLGSYIVHNHDLDQKELSTIFWFSILIGTIISMIFFFSSGFISNFYNEPALESIAKIISINFIVSSFSIVPFSLLRQRMDFKSIFKAQTVATIISGIGGIYLAYNGFGVWSLVFKAMVFTGFGCILYWIFSGWKPRFQFFKLGIHKMLSFSLPLLGSESFNYWVRNIDNLLIGKYLGSQQLGYYDRAYSLMLLPVNNISSVIVNVLFPSFSTIKDDHPRIVSIFRLSIGCVCLIVMPLMLGLFITAENVVTVIFGQQWLPMVPVLQILSLLGISQSVVHLTSSLMLSQGRTRLILKLGLLTKTFTILMIIIGLQYGIIGVAFFYLIANLFTSPFIFYKSGSLVNMPFRETLNPILPIAIAALSMTLVVFLLGEINLFANNGKVLILLLQVFTGGITYGLLILYLKPEAFLEIKKILKTRFNV